MYFHRRQTCIKRLSKPKFVTCNLKSKLKLLSAIHYLNLHEIRTPKSSVAIPTDREFTSPSRYAISMVARASSSLGVTCLGDPLVKLESPTSLSNTI